MVVSRSWPLLVAALSVFALVGACWGLLSTHQRALLFPAPPLAGVPPRPADARSVWLDVTGGRVEAWYLPPTRAADGPAPLLLFTHGNGELIDHWPGAFDKPRSWGMAVLLLEYPGYGRSSGRPSEGSILEATLAADDWVRTQREVDATRMVPWGRSLGGAAAARLAAERPVPALILESAFTSARAFARRFGLPGFLVRDPLDTLAALRRFTGPVLVLHGDRDELVPAAHGRQLAAATPGSTFELLPCGHNDCPRPWDKVRRFLEVNRLLPADP